MSYQKKTAGANVVQKSSTTPYTNSTHNQIKQFTLATAQSKTSKALKKEDLKTIFVKSQFYTIKDATESKQKPDYIANDLQMLSKILKDLN